MFTLEARHGTGESHQLDVYVLPSICTPDEYTFMLKRIAAAHDRLLLSTLHGVGTGAEESQNELEPGTPEYDLSLWKRMKPAVLRIMEMPATLLKRDRQNLPLHKIRHFDQRTMQGITTNPGEGKVPGIVYRDDHDTLENRAIKAILTKCSHNVLNHENVHCLSDEEIEAIVNSEWEKSPQNTGIESFFRRRMSLYRLANEQQKQKEMHQASVELRQILETPWFKAITDVDSAVLPNTPTFLHNPHYREVYNCAQTLLGTHPSCKIFNPYAYGLQELNQVYEHWVLYELLNRLLNLGFRPKEGQLDACESLLRQSIANNNEKPKGIKIKLTRRIPVFGSAGSYTGEEAVIGVVLGFNCTIEISGQNTNASTLVPDYYLHVTQVYRGSQTDHWYFLDAKCIPYSNRNELVGFNDENIKKATIKGVCLNKYLNKMELGKDCLEQEDAEFLQSLRGQQVEKEECEIRGAYLLVAEVRNDGQSSEEPIDAFFGSPEHCKHPKDDKRVTHRYGAAVVHPSQYLGEDGKPAELTGADELTTLLKLIFEYREGAGLLEPYYTYRRDVDGNVVEQEKRLDGQDDAFEVIHPSTEGQLKRAMRCMPPTLFGCWNSAVRHPAIQKPLTFKEQETQGGNFKYYVTCPHCGDLRVQSFCGKKQCRREIYKYDVGNYHCPITVGKKWGFVCPHCGDGLENR